MRRDGLARVGKMYRVPQAGPRQPAVAGLVVQRGVRPRRVRGCLGVPTCGLLRILDLDAYAAPRVFEYPYQ